MAERKGYVNSDELQADDEVSPKPARDEKAADGARKQDDDAIREVPRAATSE